MTGEFELCTCITCGDQGIEMTVTELDPATGIAHCIDDAGAECEVDASLVAPVTCGTRLVAHAGVAIALAASPAQP